jgi:23S rRNA (uracil1939-C5)-methyltransferase
VARLPDGLTLFVPFSAPGDRLRVRIVERRRRFARAEIGEILEAGPGRITPRCAFFGRCGGCEWQHLDYRVQVQAKREILREALVRIGGWTPPTKLPFVPSPSPYGYRTRTRLLVGHDGIGYRERGSHALCAVDSCPVLVSSLDGELSRLAAAPRARQSSGSRVEWELVADRHGRPRSRPLDAIGHAEPQGLDDRIEVMAGSDPLKVSAGTFLQANLLLHDQLHGAVLDAAGRGRRALELHAGAGFFTLALARRFEAVEAIESSPGAVADLRANLRAAGLEGVRVTPGDVEERLESAVLPHPDLILLDPPRTGLSLEALGGLAKQAAPRIVYLSCDPATLARDSARLRIHGYALESVRGFDLFPQTSHVEALAVLVRSAAAPGDQG